MPTELFGINIWALIGFSLAAYAVVGNDALQTLGTFINSNDRLPWWVLYLFAAGILLVVFTYGWIVNNGDPSFQRLDNFDKFPEFSPAWYHILPPLALLVLTRFGIPVSTTFMVLATFASMAGLVSMLEKSAIGYLAAFITGGVLYVILAPTLERWFIKTRESQHAIGWVILQWITTAYLWGVWLIQDFANIFIYLPRNQVLLDEKGQPLLDATGQIMRSNDLTAPMAFGGLALIMILLFITFANQGGPVQRILRSKTSVTDIRSATVIDFVFGTLLFIFAGNLAFFGIDKVPMSTTWVFLGLIAGREFAIATIDKIRSPADTAKIVLSDAAKALFGLAISVGLAFSMPWLAQQFG
jgi:phosphate/sulfate permease